MTKPIRVIDRALKLAKARGMNQTAFGKAMDGAGPATITNWKARDMPPERHEKAAAVLGVTVDELLGKAAAPADANGESPWPLRSITRSALAALPEAKLEQIDQILAAVIGTPVPPDWRSSAYALAAELDKVMRTTHNQTFVETVDKHHVERLAEHQRQASSASGETTSAKKEHA